MSSYSLVVGVGSAGSWVTAALEPLSEGVNLEPGTDPKDTYCTHIFYPGRFQRSVVSKALVVSGGDDVCSHSVFMLFHSDADVSAINDFG